MQFFGGISSSIFTNILSFVVLYVVFKMSSFDIMGNLNLFKALALVPATLFLILRCVYIDNESAEQYVFDFYYYCRFASILFNFIAFIIISRRTYWYKTKNAGVDKSTIELAINVLATRMIYYPLLQAVSILPAAVYESVVSIHRQNPTSSGAVALDVIFAILTPSTGIGYLVIFLVMQPNAYKHFRSLITTGRPYIPHQFTDSYDTGSPNISDQLQHPEEGEGVTGNKAGRPTPNEIFKRDVAAATAVAAKSTDGSHHTGQTGVSGGGSSGFNIHNYNRESDSASWVDSMQYLEEEDLIEEIERSRGSGYDSARSSRTIEGSPHLSTSPGSGHNTKHLSWINFKRSKPLNENIEL